MGSEMCIRDRGVIGITLEIPLERPGEVPLRFEWDENNPDEESIITINSDIIVNPDSGPLQVVLAVFLILAGLVIAARMLWGPKSDDE